MGQVLLMGLAAGLCTAVGALALFFKRNWNEASLSVFLGLAAGVMVAVVLLDMLPSALIYDFYAGMAGVALGVLVMALFNNVITQRNANLDSLVGLGYLIMLGIAMHDLPEGMAIALGTEMKARTGIVIALAIGIHNIPEGMAIAAPLLMGGERRKTIMIRVVLLGLITPLGTGVGVLMVDVLPGLLPWLMGLASGIMAYLVVFQLWPEAGYKDKRMRWIGCIIGFIVITAATFL